MHVLPKGVPGGVQGGCERAGGPGIDAAGGGPGRIDRLGADRFGIDSGEAPSVSAGGGANARGGGG